MVNQTPLYLIGSEKYSEIAGAAAEGFETYGREFLGRDFVVVPAPAEFHLFDQAVSNGELNIDDYREGLQNYFEANRTRPVFSLNVTGMPLFTMSGGKNKRYVNATSWQLHDLKTREIISNQHAGVVISTAPLFTPYSGDNLQQAMAYALAFHELGHLAGENFCKDDSCVFSHPKDRRNGLEEKARAILSSGGITVCPPCKDLMRKVGGENDQK